MHDAMNPVETKRKKKSHKGKGNRRQAYIQTPSLKEYKTTRLKKKNR